MRQTVAINDNGGEKRQKEFAMNETCMNHALNMPNIGCCPYCRIAELEQQLAHKQEQCDQLAHQVLELEEQNERDRYHGRDFIRLWKEGKEHIAELEQQLSKATRILQDVHLISPGQPGCGDLSREQRTLADVARFIKEVE